MNTLQKLLYINPAQNIFFNFYWEEQMPKINNFTGKTFGIWRVVSQTDKRTSSGNIIYKCLNTNDNKIYLKNSSYLIQFKARNSKKTTPGRKRKWIIKKWSGRKITYKFRW